MEPYRKPNIEYLTGLAEKIIKFAQSCRSIGDDATPEFMEEACKEFLEDKEPYHFCAVHTDLKCMGMQEATELAAALEDELVGSGVGLFENIEDTWLESPSAEYRETIEDNRKLRKLFKVYQTETDKDEEGPVDIGQLLPEGRWDGLLDSAMSSGAKKSTVNDQVLNPIEHLYFSCGGRHLRKKLSDPECKKKIYAEILNAQLTDYVVIGQMAMQVLTNHEQVYKKGYMSDESSLFNSALRIKIKSDEAVRAVMAADAKLQGLSGGSLNINGSQTQINIGIQNNKPEDAGDKIQNPSKTPRHEVEANCIDVKPIGKCSNAPGNKKTPT